ncbi:chemotaxis protein [Novosphingobium sp.]|uniref:chemotaxis protein n=1 Tax=Novosphingobium sp. TaxID=1874826 RepID=UPI0038B8868F
MRHEVFPDASGATPWPGEIEPGAATPSGSDLGLGDVVATLDDRFIPAGMTLGRLVETIASVLRGLDVMEGAFGEETGGKAAKRLLTAGEQMRAAPQRQAERTARIEALHTVIARLSGLSEEVARVLTVLEFYTVNLKIAAAGEHDFVEFAQDMRAKLVDGGRQVEDFQRQVRVLQSSLRDMKGVDDVLAHECARVIPAVPDTLVAEVGRLQARQQHMSTVSVRTRGLALSLQSRIGEALGALQVGDIARQRIEHVIEGLAMLEAELASAPPADGTVASDAAAAQGRFLALLTALLEDAGQEFAHETGRLLDALTALGPDCDALLGKNANEQAISAGGAFLHTMGDCIADARKMSHQLQVADTKAGAISEVVLGVVNALRERVKVVEDLRVEVDYMAINVNIRARREASIGRPVAVIADAIRTASQDLAALTEMVNTAAEELGSISETLESNRIHAGGSNAEADLTAALEAIDTCAGLADQAMQDVDQQSGEIVGLLRETTGDLSVSTTLSRKLASAAAQLGQQAADHSASALSGSDGVLQRLLERLGVRYSMASERIIHNRHLLPGMTALGGADIASPVAEQSDDDLFDSALF